MGGEKLGVWSEKLTASTFLGVRPEKRAVSIKWGSNKWGEKCEKLVGCMGWRFMPEKLAWALDTNMEFGVGNPVVSLNSGPCTKHGKQTLFPDCPCRGASEFSGTGRLDPDSSINPRLGSNRGVFNSGDTRVEVKECF